MDANEALEPLGISDDYLSLATCVGDALQLQDFSSEKRRYYANLIGYLSQRSLTVTHPIANEKLLDVSVGERFFVRGFSGTKTYEFNTTILGVCSAPYPYLHLTYPESVSTLQMRGAMRIKVKLACYLIAAVQGLKIPGYFNDLSTSGASIQSSAKLGKTGDVIQLHFSLLLEGQEHLFVLSAIVRNVTAIQADNTVVYGIEFVVVSNRVRIALQTYICSILIAEPSA